MTGAEVVGTLMDKLGKSQLSPRAQARVQEGLMAIGFVFEGIQRALGSEGAEAMPVFHELAIEMIRGVDAASPLVGARS